MSLLAKAVELAAIVHAGQVDKGGAPYILHPLRVMLSVTGEQAQIAAVLHDTVEDSKSGFSLNTIRSYFGDRITAAVDALTRREGESYDSYIDRAKADDIARAVKLADLKDNCDVNRLNRPLTADDKRRFDKYMRARALLQE